ncbi:MAG: DUF2177 family protein [Saprospiraceae bacterium]
MKYFLLYLIATLIFFTIDMIWLGWLAKDFYWKKLDFILTDQTNWTAAIIFYLIYIAGILYFAVVPGLNAGNWQIALLNGALFGFFCYATYDLTNMALIKGWPLEVVIIDIIWGAVLTGSVAVLSYLLGNKFIGF